MPEGPFYEKGVYRCKIVAQAMSVASTGNPQFVIRFKVVAQVFADGEEPVETEYERTCFRTITEKTMPYFLEDLKALGFEGDSFRELDPKQSGHYSFIGSEIEMVCNHESGLDGKLREKWNIRREGSGTLDVKELEPAKLRQLDNLFGKALKDAFGRKATPVQQDQAHVSDDDVPF